MISEDTLWVSPNLAYIRWNGQEAVNTQILGVIVEDDINHEEGGKNLTSNEFSWESGASISRQDYEKVRLCSCTLFVKQYYEVLQNKIIYSPRWLWQNYKEFGLQKFDEPMINFLVITRDNPTYWHIGIVIDKTETEITILENNYIPCITATRSVDIYDSKIVGYLY